MKIIILILILFLTGCSTIPRTVNSIQNTTILLTDADETWKTCQAQGCTLTYSTFKLVIVNKDYEEIEKVLGHEMLHVMGILDKDDCIKESK